MRAQDLIDEENVRQQSTQMNHRVKVVDHLGTN